MGGIFLLQSHAISYVSVGLIRRILERATREAKVLYVDRLFSGAFPRQALTYYSETVTRDRDRSGERLD